MRIKMEKYKRKRFRKKQILESTFEIIENLTDNNEILTYYLQIIMITVAWNEHNKLLDSNDIKEKKTKKKKKSKKICTLDAFYKNIIVFYQQKRNKSSNVIYLIM